MNENDEKWLRDLSLRPPSASLDTRIQQLIAAHGTQPLPARRFTLWQCAAACAACAAAAFLGAFTLLPQGEAAQPITQVRYVVETPAPAYDVFDWTKYPKNVAPNSMLPARHALDTNNNAI